MVDCENINKWLALFKQYLNPRHGHSEVLAMQVPVIKLESERQLRLNSYVPINQQIRKTIR